MAAFPMLYPISFLGNSIRVKLADFYGLHGNNTIIWFSLVDREDRTTHVFFDFRLDSPTRNRLFEGARSPGRSGATLVELGFEEEGGVIATISSWLDSSTPKSLGLTEYGWEMIRDYVLRYGEPVI